MSNCNLETLNGFSELTMDEQENIDGGGIIKDVVHAGMSSAVGIADCLGNFAFKMINPFASAAGGIVTSFLSPIASIAATLKFNLCGSSCNGNSCNNSSGC